MKRIMIIGFIAALFLTACEIHPYADFVVNNRFVQPNETVNFTNVSENSTSFHWDFGDGTYSNVPNPTHVYTSEGIFVVSLTAYSRDGNTDRATIEIEVYYDVELEVTVAEWNRDYIIDHLIADASVRLYPSLYDWDHETNMVVEGFTDNYGVVLFTGLLPQRYYVDVWTPYYNNFLLRDDDPDFVTTKYLSQFYYNTFIAWVDPIQSSNQKEGREKTASEKINRPHRTLVIIDVSK
jgi:PKD repeat protein